MDNLTQLGVRDQQRGCARVQQGNTLTLAQLGTQGGSKAACIAAWRYSAQQGTIRSRGVSREGRGSRRREGCFTRSLRQDHPTPLTINPRGSGALWQLGQGHPASAFVED